MQFSLVYASDIFDTRTKIMGRQSAGHGFLRAVLAAKFERVWCYAANRASAEIFARDVLQLTQTPPEIRFIAWEQPAKLTHAGLLYRADPGIGVNAWHRRHHAHSRAYSLCGVTHTLASLAAMNTIVSLMHAPLYSWDAVICTSTAARDIVRRILETEMEYLRGRFGASHFTLPQLPLIPLGTHLEDFTFSDEIRAKARARLDLGAEDVAALFAGRLTFHGKAHPLPMFLGLQAAAEATQRSVHLILFGKFPNDRVAAAFREEAARLAPSVRLIVLDGDSDADREAAWAGADFFTSLADNVQETFGLTPIEAMAAGLPVVVSDWNGYKDTVRDGIDGFRVTTVMPPPGAGMGIIDRYDMRIDDFDYYLGHLCQFAAVEIEALTVAYRRIIESSELRRQMGASGRQRVKEHFDWSVVFRRYIALWDELAERRRADPLVGDEKSRTPSAERLDPFQLFQTYPTKLLQRETMVRLRIGASTALALERRGLGTIGYAQAVLPAEDLIGLTISTLSSGEGMRLADLATACAVDFSPTMVMTVAWLVKMGILDLNS